MKNQNLFAIIPVAPPLAGKTTLAREIAKKFGVVRIAGDEIGEEMFPRKTTPEPGDPDFEKFLAEGKAVAKEIFKRGGNALAAGKSVIFDSHHAQAFLRAPIVEIAREAGAKVLFLDFQIPPETREKRRKIRAAEDGPNAIPLTAEQLRDWGEPDPIDPADGEIFPLREESFEADRERVFEVLAGRDG